MYSFDLSKKKTCTPSSLDTFTKWGPKFERKIKPKIHFLVKPKIHLGSFDLKFFFFIYNYKIIIIFLFSKFYTEHGEIL